MQYTALHISVSDPQLAEVLVAELAEFPFEGFTQEADVLSAYIPAHLLPACRSAVGELLSGYGLREWRYDLLEDRDWNEAWEATLTPVDVQGRIRIRAPHHEPAPEGVTEVVIRPRMAFGTGHHATTCLMAELVTDLSVAGRRGLDLGTGTGVLAILALKLGAAYVDAVDTDEWAVRNCNENAALNGVEGRIGLHSGDIDCIAGHRYDFILANINRNALEQRMTALAAALLPGGVLALSGFLTDDAARIGVAAAGAGLTHVRTRERTGWAAVVLVNRGGEAPCIEEL